jgi:hypothetical protein
MDTMRADRALYGGAGTVSLEHGTGPPPGQPHEVTFATAVAQPRMRKGVTKLMRMEGHPYLIAATADDLRDAAAGQRSLRPKPQRSRL